MTSWSERTAGTKRLSLSSLVREPIVNLPTFTENKKYELNQIETDPVYGTEFYKKVDHGMFTKHGAEKNIVPSIMMYDAKSGQLKMMSKDEFESEWETSRNTKEMREYFESKQLNENFLNEELAEREKVLNKEYNAASNFLQVKDWPAMPEYPDKCTEAQKKAIGDHYKAEIKLYYETTLAAMRREKAHKMHEAKKEETGKPKTKEEAIATSYENSAQKALEKLHERLLETDVIRLEDTVATRVTSRTYVEILKHTLDAICKVNTVRSVLWFRTQQTRIMQMMSGKVVNFSEGRQAYTAQEAELKKVFGDIDIRHAEKLVTQLTLFPDGMMTENQGASAVVHKYWAMEYTAVDKDTPGRMWGELMRVPCMGDVTLNRVIDLQPAHARPNGKRPEPRVSLIERNEEYGQKGKYYSPKCYNCGGFGHLAKECKQGKTCYNCGEEGHIAMDCSAPRIQGSHSRPSSRAPTPHRARARSDASSSRSSSVTRSRHEPTPSRDSQSGMSSYTQPERAHKSAKAVRFIGDETYQTSRMYSYGLCVIDESDCESEPEIMEAARVRTERTALSPSTLESTCFNTAQVSAVSRTSPTRLHIDTAANVNVCDPKLLSELVEMETPQKLAGFQGSQYTVTHKGVLTVIVEDELDPNRTHTMRVDMLAVKGVGEPIISWESMAANGAELRLKSGGSTIALNDANKTILRIGVDGRVKVQRIIYEEKSKILAAQKGKAPIKSALSAHPRFPMPPEKRFAPRASVRSIYSGPGN